MKKLINGIIKIFCVFIVLLILITAGILLYPKYGNNWGLEEKVTSFFPENNINEKETTETIEESTEEHWEPKEEISLKEDSNVLSKEEQQGIHKAFENIIATMGYDEESVFFYEIKNLNNRNYYAFHILDGEGNSFEYLLLSDVVTQKLYWCDQNNQLGDARATDVLYSTNKEGNKDVTYEDGNYKAVFEGYMKALLESFDEELVSDYRDTSYFYQIRMNEKDRKKNVDDAEIIQKVLINKIQNCEKDKEEGRCLSYKVKYDILSEDEFIDELGADWIDINIRVNILEEKKREIEEDDQDYIVSLRRYPYGWRVATISESL